MVWLCSTYSYVIAIYSFNYAVLIVIVIGMDIVIVCSVLSLYFFLLYGYSIIKVKLSIFKSYIFFQVLNLELWLWELINIHQS